MRVLVTGGTGFLGRAVVAELVAAGHAVVTAAVGGAPEGHPGVFEELDLFDDAAVARALARHAPEAIVHLAWCVEPATYLHTADNGRWLQATLRLFDRAAEAGVRRFFGAGTCFEYALEAGYLREGGACTPHTLYGACKLAVATALGKLAPARGVSFVWGRFFFLHGPGEPPGRLVPAVADALLRGEPARVSEGSQVRDFLSVSDAAIAVRRVLESPLEGPVNLCSGVPVRVRDVVLALADAARARGLTPEIAWGAVPTRPGDPPFLAGDATQLRALGFAPRPLAEGLAQTLAARAPSP